MPAMGTHGTGTGPFPITTKQGLTRYRVAVTMADGRRVWRTRPTKRLAELAKTQLIEARELDLDPTRQTLAAYLRSWLEGLRKARNQRVRPRTLDHYELVVEKHVIPALGAYRLSAVTARRIQAWLDADPAAPRTVRHHHAVLRRALNVAVRQRLLAYNPALAVELPDVDDDTARPLTLVEAQRLLEATAGDRFALLWRMAIVTGLREGELLGLGWEDVDGSQLNVRAQLQRLPESKGGDARGWARTPTKAARSVARVNVDPVTAAMLAEHKVRQAAERRSDDLYFGLVFQTPAGRPYHGSEVLKAFRAACEKAGIPVRRFHDLRHSSATLMREADIPEDTRMARLGHSTTQMSRHYGKASEVQDLDAAARLGRALG